MNDESKVVTGTALADVAVKKPKFDLASIDTVKAANAGAEIELKHPLTNEPLNCYITIVGRDSDTFRDFQRRKFNEYLRLEAMAKARGKNAQGKSAEEYEDDMLTLLVTCTRGWREMEYDGKVLDFTAENVRRIYRELPWIRDQVNEAVGDLGNFLKI